MVVVSGGSHFLNLVKFIKYSHTYIYTQIQALVNSFWLIRWLDNLDLLHICSISGLLFFFLRLGLGYVPGILPFRDLSKGLSLVIVLGLRIRVRAKVEVTFFFFFHIQCLLGYPT